MYGDEAGAKQGADNVQSLSQKLGAYGPLLALIGIPQPIRKLEAEAKGKEAAFVVGVDAAAIGVVARQAAGLSGLEGRGSESMSPARLVVRPQRSPLEGSVPVPSDRSITHRALILAALSNGPCELRGFAYGNDNLGTLRALGALGVRFEDDQKGHRAAARSGSGRASRRPRQRSGLRAFADHRAAAHGRAFGAAVSRRAWSAASGLRVGA